MKGLNGRGCELSGNHSDHFSFGKKKPWYLFSRVPGFSLFSAARNVASFQMGSPVHHRRMNAAKYFHWVLVWILGWFSVCHSCLGTCQGLNACVRT